MATAIIGTLKHLPKASILPTLPETGRPNRIYFIPNEDPTEDNRYNEYLWVKDETYPDGHWELVGPTTIDLTDYATKEEVSDLKDSIGEQIKKYLPLSGGTMDKGSNISFPLDSGSTVYNGSGISVGGKASTDILHAAGGTTKIKTLNGESMLGEGNIVIDPSSVPVSLSWYNRTTRCKISLNHSKSNLLKINDEVGSIRYWALKIGKAHSVLSYRLKVHGIDNLRKYIEQRIKLV